MKIVAVCAIAISATGLFYPYFSTAAQALPPAVAAALAGAQPAGNGALRFLGMEVYRAQLWVRPGFDGADWAGQPFALLRAPRPHGFERKNS